MSKQSDSFFVKISAPAQRALKSVGINSAHDLAKFTRADISRLHGMGPGSIPKLEEVLGQSGLSFKGE
jgi:hypothetical protein